MALADSNRVDLYISEETLWGETPSTPAMTQLRYTGETLAYSKQSGQSEVIRSDRMRDAILELGYSAGGDIKFELAYGSFDTLLSGLFGAAWSTPVNISSSAIAATALTDKFSGAAGMFDTVTVGQWIKVAGFYESANNGIFRVTAKAVGGGDITVDTSLADEGAGEAVTFKGSYLRNGIVEKSYLIEKRFTDITQYIYFDGMRVGGMSLNIAAKQIINGSFTFSGKEGVASASSVAGSSTAASAAVPLSASANVGTITRNNVALATPLKSITLNVNNNPRAKDRIGSKAAAGIGLGFFEVTGTVEAYFEDLVLYNLLIGHTVLSLSWRCTDSAGNVVVFTIPSLYFMEGDPKAESGNQDVMLPLTFAAIRNATYNCALQIDIMAA